MTDDAAAFEREAFEPDPEDEPPACPFCSLPMVFCAPGKEKAYWACARTHETRGIVMPPQEVDYAFHLARIGIYDKFERGVVEPFDAADAPEDVVGLVPDLVSEKMQSWREFKQMRQRKGHDDLDGVCAGSVDADQSGLGRWSG